MSAHADLLNVIFEEERPALYLGFEQWLQSSRRFRAFAGSNRAKIRAKRRHARDEGSLLDLRAELETAMLLLREERFTLEYEMYAASKQRGPDFTVTFRTHTPFNVEVRRIRSAELTESDNIAQVDKLTAILSDKLGQMPPGIANLLWLCAEGDITVDDVTAALEDLRHRAERKDEQFLVRQGFAGAAAFVQQYTRLSGIVLHKDSATTLWLNPIARHRIPPAIATALRGLSLPV
jgi:hypothetical protein